MKHYYFMYQCYKVSPVIFLEPIKVIKKVIKSILKNDWKYWLCIIHLSLIPLQPLCTLSLSCWSHTCPLPDVFWLLGWVTFGSPWALFELAYSQSKCFHLLKVRCDCAGIQNTEVNIQLKANTAALLAWTNVAAANQYIWNLGPSCIKRCCTAC